MVGMIIQNRLGMHGKSNDECDVWMPINVPDGWSRDNEEFMCGVCMVKEMIKF